MTGTPWSPHGGLFAGTAALEHLLAHAEVDLGEPWDGWPASEALLLGLGGLGFSVNLYPGPWGVHLALGSTRATGSGVLQRDICRRLGVRVEIEETGNAVLAGKALAERVDAGRPVLLWGSKAALPYLGFREDLAPVTEHLWVVTGHGPEPETFEIVDLAPGPLHLSKDEVAGARAALFTAKHRRMTLAEPDPEGRAREPLDPEHQILGALEATLQALREPLLPTQGLPGLRHWAENLGDSEGPWARQIAAESGLFDVLTGLFRSVQLETGGALRGLWADFLHQVETRFAAPALAEVEELYRLLARDWSDLATAALPENQPVLAEARRLLTERDRLFRRQGWRREGAAAKLDRSFRELRDEGGRKLVGSGTGLRALLADLGDRVHRIHRQETRAAEALATAVVDSRRRSRRTGATTA